MAGVVINLEMPQDGLESARLTSVELKTELASALYAQQLLCDRSPGA
jgi:hypothetical protein